MKGITKGHKGQSNLGNKVAKKEGKKTKKEELKTQDWKKNMNNASERHNKIKKGHNEGCQIENEEGQKKGRMTKKRCKEVWKDPIEDVRQKIRKERKMQDTKMKENMKNINEGRKEIKKGHNKGSQVGGKEKIKGRNKRGKEGRILHLDSGMGKKSGKTNISPKILFSFAHPTYPHLGKKTKLKLQTSPVSAGTLKLQRYKQLRMKDVITSVFVS